MKRFSEFLSESPEIVKGTDFALNNSIHNRTLLHNLIKKKQEVIIPGDDYEVFRSGTKNNGNLVMWNKQDDLIDYYVMFERKKYSNVGDFVTQIKLWRRGASPHAIGITRKIFFNYLLQKYKAIMSDTQQTKDGKEFWKQRMAEATTKNYRVGLADLNMREIIWFDPKESTYIKWIQSIESNAWGVGNKFQARRFIISN